jgi:hypothetical protein
MIKAHMSSAFGPKAHSGEKGRLTGQAECALVSLTAQIFQLEAIFELRRLGILFNF